MRSPQHVLLLALSLSLSLTLLAQPTKTKTKTEAGKAKTKTEANKAKTDANKAMMDTMATTMNPNMDMEGSGGGMGNMAAPYKATYSSQFTMGDPQHTNLVLMLWKDWDDNMLDRNAAMVADTIVMEMPNGTMVRGKDSFLMGAKDYRGQYTTVKSTVEAVMPLHSTDRNENWVAIWGVEESTKGDGMMTRTRLHEIWRINKDGKIDFVRQFAVPLPAK